MPDPLSPLRGQTASGRHGAVGTEGIILGARPLLGLWQVAGWDDFEPTVQPVLKAVQLAELGGYRSFQNSSSCTAWRIAPDRILFETDVDLTALGSRSLAVLDLHHARTVITLSGPEARTLLSQVVATDTSPQAFGTGAFVQTGIHHVGVLISCTGEDQFDIMTPATWAESVWDYLCENAMPLGIRIREA